MSPIRYLVGAAPLALGAVILWSAGQPVPDQSGSRATPGPRQLSGPAATRALAPGGGFASLGEALTRARYRIDPVPSRLGTFAADNPAHRLVARFRPAGVELTPHTRAGQPGRRAAFRTVAIGRGNIMLPLTPDVPTAREDGVEYLHRTTAGPALTEWWRNTPSGVEQGWTVGKDEGGRMVDEKGACLVKNKPVSPLAIVVSVEGNLTPLAAQDGQSVDLRDAAGTPVLHGAELKAWDATGRTLPIQITTAPPQRLNASTPQRLTLSVDDSAAIYPITVDPTWTQQAKLTEPGPPAGNPTIDDFFSSSVALDGDTAVIGAPLDNLTTAIDGGTVASAGAAYVFTRSGVAWTFKQKLTAAADAQVNGEFGGSVAVSGNRVVVGAPAEDQTQLTDVGDETPMIVEVDAPDTGAAYVFNLSGGVYTRQTRLTETLDDRIGSERFGAAVALDGDTLAVGAPGEYAFGEGYTVDKVGAAYVFVNAGAAWTQQARLIQSIEDDDLSFLAQMGYSLDLDGDTLVAGAPGDDQPINGVPEIRAGAVYVFVRSGTTWTQQAKLVEPEADDRRFEFFGISVALDGDTVLVGVPNDNATIEGQNRNDVGSVYVFTRSGGVWTQEAILTEPTTERIAEDEFGISVALEGNTAVVGAWGNSRTLGGDTIPEVGSATVFTRSGGVWTAQQVLSIPDTDVVGSELSGYAVALSGKTVVMSSDGNSPLIGGTVYPYAGAAYVFTLPNTPPSVQADKSLNVTEDTITGLGITAPTDADGDSLTITINTVPTAGKGLVKKAGGGATVTASSTLTSAELTGLEFHPVANANGAAGTFTYTVTDGKGGSVSQTVTINITAVNDAPVADAQSVITSEDTAKAITLTAADLDNDSLTYTVTTPPSHGTLAGTAPNLTYTPALNYHGTDSFQFKVNDGTVDSAVATVSLTITAVNDAPTADAQTVATNEDTAKAITLTASDVEMQSLTYTVTSDPSHGTLSGTPPNVTYTPAGNYNGSDTFQFKANDGTDDSAIATVSLTVTAVNDAPTFIKGADQTVNQNAGPQAVSGWATALSAGAPDENMQVLTFQVTDNSNPALFATAPAVDAVTGTLAYTPAEDARGTATVTLRLLDDGGKNNGGEDASATQTFTITVNGAPAAQADSYSLTWNQPYTVGAPGVLENDTDPESQALTAVKAAEPGHGTVVLNATGGFTYTPAAHYFGADSFTYYAVDADGSQSAPATVSLTISSGYTVTAPTTVAAGAALTAAWTAPAGHSANDWIALFRTDIPGPAGYVGWSYLGAANSGSFTVAAPAPGTYVFRVYVNDSGVAAASSSQVTTTGTPVADYTLTISPTSVAPGGAYTVTWNAAGARTPVDWIAVYVNGTAGPTGYVAWFYTGGTLSGSRSLTAPAAGTYVARYYLNDSSVLGATSNTLTVTAPAAPTITANTTTVSTGGLLTATWTAPAGRPTKDWVALVRLDQLNAGPPQSVSGYVKWAYTGGATSGSAQFALSNVAPGTYYCVYLLNDATTVGAVSAPVTVTP